MAHDEHNKPIEADPNAGYDKSEPKAGFIVAFGIATIITLVITILGIQFYFEQAKEHIVYEDVLKPESNDIKNLRAREDKQLSGFSVEDKAKGTVRLPIERAMDLYVKEAGEGKFAYPTKEDAIKTDFSGGPVPVGAPPTIRAAAAPPAVAGGATNNPANGAAAPQSGNAPGAVQK